MGPALIFQEPEAWPEETEDILYVHDDEMETKKDLLGNVGETDSCLPDIDSFPLMHY
jgi:hypothetical protein